MPSGSSGGASDEEFRAFGIGVPAPRDKVDGWMPSLGYAPLDRLPGMRDRVATAAAAAGRSMDDITCAPNVEVRVGDVRPGVISGSPDQVAERLRALTGMGFTVLNLKPSGPGRDEQVERLAREVLPAV
ncbi:hypothetical protein GCM10009827_008560 [Dactylosporangium maewongense]|uniref:Luciferase-like domain-containing protein n=1 Tax=Dactylosporangium maewongense TaxID=634393 RepID=A0ABN1ZLY9_9ACTN